MNKYIDIDNIIQVLVTTVFILLGYLMIGG